jgi:3-phenylpropionate/cinnamic acid dioxygenase small subunit
VSEPSTPSAPDVSTVRSPEEGVRRTLAQYFQLCDDGRFAEWSDLFTVDARFHVLGRTCTGRDEIRAFIEVGQSEEKRGRHVGLVPVIDVEPDGRRARAWTDYLFVDRERAITSVGRYHDELELGDDGRWRISLREIVMLGGSPELAQPPPG